MNRTLSIVILVGINILWGSTYAVTKVALLEISPPLLGALRWITATVLLWLIQLWQVQQSKRSGATVTAVADVDKLRLVGLGAFGLGVAYLFSYAGINLTTATDASLMIIGEVIFTALLAAWLTHEPLGQSKLLGMGLGAIGVAVLVLGHMAGDSDPSGGWWRAVGDLLILVALALQAIYTVLGSKLARRYPPMSVLTYVCTGSLLIWLPVLLWQGWRGALPTTLSPQALGGVLYLAVVASVFCNFVWFSIASRIGAGLSALSLFAQPLVGVFVGLIFLQEPLTVSLAMGAALIFVALYLTSTATPAQPADTAVLSSKTTISEGYQ